MYPFDSERKRMSAIRQVGQERVLFVKGAAQSMIDRCTHIFSGGKVVALEDLQRKNLLDQNHDRANHARRQLVYAYRVLDADEEIATEDDIVESDLICLGMVSMIDPPRPEVHEAIQAAYDAHIRVTVITGDHALTATAIAQQV
jgi:Ca2+-transporting ATPase